MEDRIACDRDLSFDGTLKSLRLKYHAWSDGGEKLAASNMMRAVLDAAVSYGIMCRITPCLELRETLKAAGRKLPRPRRRESIIDRKAAGLSEKTWARDLRASGITEGRAASIGTDDAAKVAGHASTKTTSDVYDRASLEAAERFADARSKNEKRNRNASGNVA